MLFIPYSKTCCSVWSLTIGHWALGHKNDLIELIDHLAIAFQRSIPNSPWQRNLYWIGYMKSSLLRILWYVTDTIWIMLQKKKIIINHCTLHRCVAVDFFVNLVLPLSLKFINTHYHIQKQREKIEGNPTEKMSCHRYNKN